MKLSELQKKFTLLTAELIAYAYSHGYSLTFGEAYRPPETAALYAKQGRGSAKSLHCQRLAIDFNLFLGNQYLTDSKDYEFLGEHWEQLGNDEFRTRWGGRFKNADGNHFSIEYEGRA